MPITKDDIDSLRQKFNLIRPDRADNPSNDSMFVDIRGLLSDVLHLSYKKGNVRKVPAANSVDAAFIKEALEKLNPEHVQAEPIEIVKDESGFYYVEVPETIVAFYADDKNLKAKETEILSVIHADRAKNPLFLGQHITPNPNFIRGCQTANYAFFLEGCAFDLMLQHATVNQDGKTRISTRDLIDSVPSCTHSRYGNAKFKAQFFYDHFIKANFPYTAQSIECAGDEIIIPQEAREEMLAAFTQLKKATTLAVDNYEANYDNVRIIEVFNSQASARTSLQAVKMYDAAHGTDHADIKELLGTSNMMVVLGHPKQKELAMRPCSGEANHFFQVRKKFFPATKIRQGEDDVYFIRLEDLLKTNAVFERLGRHLDHVPLTATQLQAAQAVMDQVKAEAAPHLARQAQVAAKAEEQRLEAFAKGEAERQTAAQAAIIAKKEAANKAELEGFMQPAQPLSAIEQIAARLETLQASAGEKTNTTYLPDRSTTTFIVLKTPAECQIYQDVLKALSEKQGTIKLADEAEIQKFGLKPLTLIITDAARSAISEKTRSIQEWRDTAKTEFKAYQNAKENRSPDADTHKAEAQTAMDLVKEELVSLQLAGSTLAALPKLGGRNVT